MGIFLFLIVFLILTVVILPFFQGKREVKEGSIEIKGIDGTVLLFSQEGLSLFRAGEFKFFKKDDIKEISLKKSSQDTVILTVRTSTSYYEIPVKRDELVKLFHQSKKSVEFSVPWLPIVFGTATSLLLADILSHEIVTLELNSYREEHKFNDENKIDSLENQNSKEDDLVDYEQSFDDFSDFQ